MKRLLSLAVAVMLLGSVSGYVFAGRNHDDVPGHECEQGEHTHNPHCISASPSVSSTPTPEVTQEPCSYDAVVLVLKDDEEVPCHPTETPSPTVTVTETPSPTPTSPTCGQDEHLNNAGTQCLKWELGGAPESTWTQEDYDKNFPGEGKFHGVAK